ncbi:MAG: trehalose-phosphatase [Acidothermales bacterium]|nr:trehalose-phosphatase [Acidothermales bacterium]
MRETSYQPKTAAGRDALRVIRERPADALVAVDFDGTLAPIVDDPIRARPVPGTAATLARLADRVGALAVITGRPAATGVAYAGLGALAGRSNVVLLGHYGAERWEAATGSYVSAPAPPRLADVRDALPGIVAAVAGASIEDKQTSLAVHVRGCEDPDAALARLVDPVRVLADRTGLAVQPGRMVLEIRDGSRDKGSALRDLVAERGAGAVLFAGDDLGDLAAYAVVEELRAAGTPGLTVASVGPGPVSEVTERADLVLAGPADVVAFLATLAESPAPPPS